MDPQLLATLVSIVTVFVVGIEIWANFKQTIANCTVTILEHCIRIETDRKYLFYPKNMEILISNIHNISGNMDFNGYKPFVQIRCSGYPKNFMLLKVKGQTLDLENWSMWKEIENIVNLKNAKQPVNHQITKKSFYNALWAKLLAISFSLIFIAICYMKYDDSTSIAWFQLLGFGSITLLFITNTIFAWLKDKKAAPLSMED